MSALIKSVYRGSVVIEERPELPLNVITWKEFAFRPDAEGLMDTFLNSLRDQYAIVQAKRLFNN